MDKDLEEALRSFSGYSVEKWMQITYKTMAIEVQKLRDAIRKHRDEKFHDRCWEDDKKLYKTLPEGLKGDQSLPPKEEFLENCKRYWEHRKDSTKEFLLQKDIDDGSALVKLSRIKAQEHERHNRYIFVNVTTGKVEFPEMILEASEELKKEISIDSNIIPDPFFKIEENEEKE